ncbi:hypothetical protein [Corynebacterium glutamicum]|uniref:hypothetical protein n=1 Tax=Corynebacterium glutamicum TaxID=1718 RepID=UPI0014665111|nr:hypothetical protein [Corynebacterium glutamicum]GFK19297.1 hypothetical protein KbCgl_18690 [Corynebacterium glutamicum]
MHLDDARLLLAKLTPTDLSYLRCIRNGENPLISAKRLNVFRRHTLLHIQSGRAMLTQRGQEFLAALDQPTPPAPDGLQAA